MDIHDAAKILYDKDFLAQMRADWQEYKKNREALIAVHRINADDTDEEIEEDDGEADPFRPMEYLPYGGGYR